LKLGKNCIKVLFLRWGLPIEAATYIYPPTNGKYIAVNFRAKMDIFFLDDRRLEYRYFLRRHFVGIYLEV